MPATAPSQTVANRVDPDRFQFGVVMEGNRDIDGDCFADVIIGPNPNPPDPFHDRGPPNAVYVYHGSSAGLADPPFETIRSPRQINDQFASVIALGDVTATGGLIS
jgi:hypothetical protein